MFASSLLFDFHLTRPFIIGTSVVCCSFYLYFGAHNATLTKAEESAEEYDPEESLLKPTSGPVSARARADSCSSEE